MEPFQRPQPSAATYTRSLNGRPAVNGRPVVSSAPIRGRSIDGVNRPIVSRRLPPAPTPVVEPQPVQPVSVVSPVQTYQPPMPAPVQPIAQPAFVTETVQPQPLPANDDMDFSIDTLLSRPPINSEVPVVEAPRAADLAPAGVIGHEAPSTGAKPQRQTLKSRLHRFKTVERRGLALVIAVGLLVALGGGSAAAYYGAVVPSRPDNVLSQALVNAIGNAAESQTFKGEISSPNYQFLLSGSSAQSGAYQFKVNATINGTQGSFDVVSNDGQKVYVRGNQVAGLATGTQANEQAALIQSILKLYTPVLQKLDGQWYQFGSPVKPMTEADQAAIAKLYAQTPVLKIQEIAADEKIGDDDSYHYKVVVNGDNLRSLLINLKNEGVGGFDLTQDKLSLINDTIQKTDFNQRPIDIWIRKDGKLINQIALNTSGVSVKMTYGDFGKPVSIAAPNGYKPSSDVYDELQSIRSSDALYSSGIMDGDNSAIGVLLMTTMH